MTNQEIEEHFAELLYEYMSNRIVGALKELDMSTIDVIPYKNLKDDEKIMWKDDARSLLRAMEKKSIYFGSLTR